MNILKIKLIGAALLFTSSTAFAEPDYYAVSGISDASSLILRAWPSSSSNPINNIPHNAIKIETTGKHIFKENKKWLQVMYQNNVGWVEADYLAIMQAASVQPIATTKTQPAETTGNTAAFTYSQQTTTVGNQQLAPQNIPWTPEEDTIYNDPTPSQLAGTNLIERVEATHTLVVINNNKGDFPGESIAGNRYESIHASMSVQYQP